MSTTNKTASGDVLGVVTQEILAAAAAIAARRVTPGDHAMVTATAWAVGSDTSSDPRTYGGKVRLAVFQVRLGGEIVHHPISNTLWDSNELADAAAFAAGLIKWYERKGK